jgi:predicted DNA-binding transcriptional regulator AlpA
MPNVRKLPEFLNEERILDFRQGAQLYGVSTSTWRRLDRAGKLPPSVQVSARRKGWRVRDLLSGQ